MHLPIFLGEMEITKREILFSTTILAVMIGLGVWLSNPIISSVSEKALETVSAVQVRDAEKFGYIKRTNAGNFYAEGSLIATDTIKLPELPRGYSFIEKVKEKYEAHTETYTTTDGKGHTQVHTRVVYEWEVKHRDKYETAKYRFLGQEFTKQEIGYQPYGRRDTTIYDKKIWGSDTRYVYYTTPIFINGTMSGTADGKTYENLHFKPGTKIEKIVKNAENNIQATPIVFWILWIMLTGSFITLFFLAENRWLY